MITITRKDISPGYQVAQTAHSISQFAYKHNKTFTQWITGYNCIVSLSTDNEEELHKLYDELGDVEKVLFEEPDIDNQATAVCFFADAELRKKFSNLSLALREKKIA